MPNETSLLTVSPSPHIRSDASTQKIMADVLIALAPAAAVSIVVSGLRALLVIAVCCASCVIFEYLSERILKRPNTVSDLSACVTGVLLAFNVPADIPLWQCVVGSLVAIVLVKQLFGGIGKNFANPAITARIFMFLAFGKAMATFAAWTPGEASVITALSDRVADGVTSATPLAFLAAGDKLGLWQLFVGAHGGSLGETSALAMILGFVYLNVKKVITWETPVVFTATVFALSALFGLDPLRSILSGGLLLGAVFMATDYVTTPITFWGRVIFGAGAGILTAVIRKYGSYPEGVSFSILFMNILTPYINRATLPRPLGIAKREKGGKK